MLAHDQEGDGASSGGHKHHMQLLHAQGLVVRHHPSQAPVLAGVSITLERGEVVAVVGSNGSGKSTLARALAGLLPLEAGRITGAGGRPPRVGLVLQDPAAQLVAATVADEVAIGAQAAATSAAAVAGTVDRIVDEHGLGSVWHRDPAGLSGGQQQRVAVASIDACEVDVLVYDEPTAMLDAPARRGFASRVRERAHGRASVWITQEPDEVAACDRVIVLDAGAVAWSGATASYVADPTIPATWGLELPMTARIAHDLRAAGAWPADAPAPLHVEQLLATLGVQVERG
jgi:energy-coupling factor transport system ATP-binding protein